MKRARFEVAHDFVKLAPARNVSLVIEVQVAVGEFSTQAAGSDPMLAPATVRFECPLDGQQGAFCFPPPSTCNGAV